MADSAGIVGPAELAVVDGFPSHSLAGAIIAIAEMIGLRRLMASTGRSLPRAHLLI